MRALASRAILGVRTSGSFHFPTPLAMTRCSHVIGGLAAALLVSSCASAGPASSNPTPDRVLVSASDGTVLRQSGDPNSRMSFAASPEKVWNAVRGAYAEIGLEANTADVPGRRYGVLNYTMPRRLHDTPISSLFACGSNMTGALVDQGRVKSDVITTLSLNADGTTDAMVFVTGVLRKSDGASVDPISCASTGHLEEMLRAAIASKLGLP